MSNTKKLKTAKQILRSVGITANYQREWEQYRVNFINGTEDTAYYTNEVQDAFETGLAMARRKNELEGATTYCII
jgi:hypothetical protein